MSNSPELCTFFVGDHLFGIDATDVQEIMQPQRITRVPLASNAVAGLLNVRGALVTAIDLRRRLGLPPLDGCKASMNIVIRTSDGPVSLLVDNVGEVIKVAAEDCEAVPPTLRGPAHALTEGVVKLNHQLLLRLNTDAVIGVSAAEHIPKHHNSTL